MRVGKKKEKNFPILHLLRTERLDPGESLDNTPRWWTHSQGFSAGLGPGNRPSKGGTVDYNSPSWRSQTETQKGILTVKWIIIPHSDSSTFSDPGRGESLSTKMDAFNKGNSIFTDAAYLIIFCFFFMENHLHHKNLYECTYKVYRFIGIIMDVPKSLFHGIACPIKHDHYDAVNGEWWMFLPVVPSSLKFGYLTSTWDPFFWSGHHIFLFFMSHQQKRGGTEGERERQRQRERERETIHHTAMQRARWNSPWHPWHGDRLSNQKGISLLSWLWYTLGG